MVGMQVKYNLFANRRIVVSLPELLLSLELVPAGAPGPRGGMSGGAEAELTAPSTGR